MNAGAPRAEQCYFRSGNDTCAALWQAPAAERGASVAVIMLPSIGVEYVRGYRHIRLLAERLASIGVAALRLDYPATGNSTNIDADVDLVERWRIAVTTSIRLARSRVPGARIVLLGRRYGGLVAVDAAARHAVDGVVLWDPVRSASSFFRELRLLHAVRDDSRAPSDDTGERGPDPLHDLEGLDLGPADLRPLAHLDYAKLDAREGMSTTVVWAPDTSAPRRSELLRKLNVSARVVEHVDARLDMIRWAEPMRSEELLRLLAQEVRGAGGGDTANHATVAVSHADEAPAAPVLVVPHLVITASGTQCEVHEYTARIPGDRELFACVTRPIEPARRTGSLVLILGTGVDHTPGPGGHNGRMARELAGHGYDAVRLDLGGIGESASTFPFDENRSYPIFGTSDVVSALRWIRREFAPTQCIVYGLCAGAYHAIVSLDARHGADLVLSVNPPLYMHQWILLELSRAKHHARVLASPEAWRHVFAGRAELGELAKTLGNRVSYWPRRVYAGLRGRRRPTLDSWRRGSIGGLFRATTRYELLFSEGDLGLQYFRDHSPDPLPDNIRLTVVPGADHTFGTRFMRQQHDGWVLRTLGIVEGGTGASTSAQAHASALK